jgi:hypothetical protein
MTSFARLAHTHTESHIIRVLQIAAYSTFFRSPSLSNKSTNSNVHASLFVNLFVGKTGLKPIIRLSVTRTPNSSPEVVLSVNAELQMWECARAKLVEEGEERQESLVRQSKPTSAPVMRRNLIKNVRRRSNYTCNILVK